MDDTKNNELLKFNWTSPIYQMNIHEDRAKLYIKREDLLPFSFGGNKVRIAQELFEDMDKKGKNCMIGYGSARSNLCRVVADISSMRKEVCHIVTPLEDDGTQIETFNSKMVKSCGAILHPCKKDNVAKTVQAAINECQNMGLLPYYMYGDCYGKGNEEVLVRAYVKVYKEIKKQSYEMGIKFDYIFLATGTGMTQAGLIAGQYLCNGKEQIIGISVARRELYERQILDKYVRAYFKSIDIPLSKFNINVSDKYLFGGYGKYGEDIKQTIRKAYFNEGLALDPTYTGKAFYGMLKTIQQKRLSGNILFIHTGGMPLFFDNIDVLC